MGHQSMGLSGAGLGLTRIGRGIVGGGGGNPPAWTPAQISSIAWYDASDLSTITESGGKVSQLDDKSGNDRHLTQGNGSIQPTTGTQDINGNNLIHFINADVLTAFGLTGIVSTNGMSVVGIVKPISDTYVLQEFCNIQKADGSDIMLLRRDGVNGISVNFTGDGGGTNFPRIKVTGDDYTVGNPMIMTHWYDNDQHYLLANGGPDTVFRDMPDNVTFEVESIYLGRKSNQTHNGVGEIIILADYDEGIRQKIEGYLAWKWDVVNLLPADHPYKFDGSEFGYTTWSPEDYKLSLWLDASDPSTVTIVTGVSQWDDKSGNDNHALQGTGSSQPAYVSGQHLVFDGSNDLMIMSSVIEEFDNMDSTVFIVMSQDAGVNFATAIGSSKEALTGNEYVYFGLNSGSSVYRVRLLSVNADTGLNNGNNFIMCGQRNADNSVPHFSVNNNAPVSSVTTNTFSNIDNSSLGALLFNGSDVQNLNGNIAEVLVFDSKISATGIQKVYEYLANKWGVTIS
jgi:hypothetical protein